MKENEKAFEFFINNVEINGLKLRKYLIQKRLLKEAQ